MNHPSKVALDGNELVSFDNQVCNNYRNVSHNAGKIDITDNSLLIWNLSSINNLFNLDAYRINYLCSFKILCFVETWLTDNTVAVPLILIEYELFVSGARKVNLTVGGIVVFYKKKLKPFINLMDASNLWLSLKIEIDKTVWVICIHYWKPSSDIQVCTDQLVDYVTNL